MHILYLHQYFTTRGGVGGTRSYEFARHFVAQGHRVTMVSAADPGLPWPGGLVRRREVDGIELVELGTGSSDYTTGTGIGYARRLLVFAGFALASLIAVLRVARADVVFATSTPLTIGLPGMLARLVHRAPMVLEVRDLWPEAPVQMGALRNPLLIWLARRLERALYRFAARIVALSPGMRAGVLAAGGAASKVSMIPNAADLDLFSPAADGTGFRARWGLAGKFVALYFGTFGAANDLTQALRAAQVLAARGVDDIVIVLCGRGGEQAALQAYAERHGLRNVLFVPPLAKAGLAEVVAAADVGLTLFKNLPVLATCSPNKLFDTLAAGRAVLVNVEGWLAELVREHECGVAARPDDPQHLADQLLWLRDHPQATRAFGLNARRLAEREFDRARLAGQLLDLLLEVGVAGRPAAEPASRGRAAGSP